MADPLYSVSVAAAVVREDGQVLAIRRRDNGRWELPGGILEHGETVHAGVIREVEEETGMTVEPEILSGVYHNIARDVIALVFRCRHVAGAPRSTHESSEVEWLTVDQVAQRMSEAFAVRLLDAVEPHAPMVRTHDGCHLLDTAARA